MNKRMFYNKIEPGIILITFSAMVILTFFNVVTRFVFGFTLSWTEQVTRILFIYLSYAGISYAGILGAHLRVTALTSVLGEQRGKRILFFGDILTILGSVYFIHVCLKMMLAIMKFKQHFSAIPWLPMWVEYLPAVIGFGGLIIRTIQRNVIAYQNNEFIVRKEGRAS